MNGEIKKVTYMPMGRDHALQKEITKLLYDTLAKVDTVPSEVGYLHMNSVTFVEDHLEVKLYFTPTLATQKTTGINGAVTYAPRSVFNALNGVMFIGKLSDNVSFETITVPWYKLCENPYNKTLYVNIRDDKKAREDEEVMVLHCNLSLVLAAIHDVDLMQDANFRVSYETVAETGKSKKDIPAQIAATVGRSNEYPVTIVVQYTEGGQYRPESAIPYLLRKQQEGKAKKRTQRELAQKVSADAAHLDKKRYKKQFKNYEKFK